MKIAIIGAGNVGRALATGWRKTGHEVTLGVRDPAGSRATELEQQGFAIAPPKDAAARAEVIVLAVPWGAVRATLGSLGALAGKIMIDATNPLTSDMSLALGHTDSGGETVARLESATGDLEDEQLPSGDELAREIERFLRRQADAGDEPA